MCIRDRVNASKARSVQCINACKTRHWVNQDRQPVGQNRFFKGGGLLNSLAAAFRHCLLYTSWGKHVAQGRALDKIFSSKEEVLDVVEKAILLFRDQGITGERFSDTIERLGFENVQKQLLSDDLLLHKEENLAAQKHLVGGATC